jgi:hypothetical protein
MEIYVNVTSTFQIFSDIMKYVWSGLVWSVHVVTSDFGLMGNPFSARICRFLRAANLQLLLRQGQCGVRVVDRYPGGSILPSLRATIQAPSSPPRINSNPSAWTGLPEEKLFFLVDVLPAYILLQGMQPWARTTIGDRAAFQRPPSLPRVNSDPKAWMETSARDI